MEKLWIHGLLYLQFMFKLNAYIIITKVDNSARDFGRKGLPIFMFPAKWW